MCGQSAGARTVLWGQSSGQLRRIAGGVRLDLTPAEPDFADWIDDQAQPSLQEIFARWKPRS